jgi:flagellar protein FlaI
MAVEVQILKTEDYALSYRVSFQGIGDATKLLLMSFRRELATMVAIDPTRIEDKEYVDELNRKYIDASELLIDKYVPGTRPDVKKLLIAYILNIMLGLGELEAPLADDNLEEVAVNGARSQIWVFHKELGWCKTNIKPASEEMIYDQAEQIGRRTGKQITNLSPLMDAELPDGSRVNATLYPVSQTGNTITIRKFSKNPWTMPMMIKNGTVSPDIAALTWLCIQNEMSIMFSGGTASGKTSFLNATSVFFPVNRRIISIEATRELSLPSFLQWIPMVSRQPNPEGKGEVTLYELMINALRQRPDIVVVGEVRTEKDAETLFEAIHTGHAVYGTVHADNAQDTIVRMTNPPINVPKIMMNALGAAVVLFRHRTKGIRRVLEFGEVLRTGDINVLYRWNLADDRFVQIAEFTRLAEQLTLYGGLTRKEIASDVEEKMKVLNWMVANNVVDVDDAGSVVASYYKNPSKIMDVVNSNAKYSKDIL